MSLLKNGDYYIHHAERFRKRFGDHIPHIIENANRDGHKVDIIIPSDPNASAQATAKLMVRKISEEGYYAKTAKTNKSKVDRFRPYSAATQNGSIQIKKHCCDDHEAKEYNKNDWYYAEKERFTGERDRSKEGHDD
jgi:phage terminase large subunit-like protein